MAPLSPPQRGARGSWIYQIPDTSNANAISSSAPAIMHVPALQADPFGPARTAAVKRAGRGLSMGNDSGAPIIVETVTSATAQRNSSSSSTGKTATTVNAGGQSNSFPHNEVHGFPVSIFYYAATSRVPDRVSDSNLPHHPYHSNAVSDAIKGPLPQTPARVHRPPAQRQCRQVPQVCQVSFRFFPAPEFLTNIWRSKSIKATNVPTTSSLKTKPAGTKNPWFTQEIRISEPMCLM